jgi:catechol 2,3-dioxygenase-like lactoylglutathione lyase family enzyme
MKLRSLLALAAVAAFPALAQLAAPNDTGVAMGHVHLVVKDVDTHKAFFSALGGNVIKNGQLEFIQYPGVFVMLRKGEPSAGSVGSRVDHFGFHVKSVADTLAKIKSFNFETLQNNPQQAFVTTSDGIKVELLEDTSIRGPIEMHHVHMFVADPAAVQAFYSKLMGATNGKRGQFDTSNLPGVELSLTKNDMALQPTKGRSLDHIGFDVKSIDAFGKRLEAQGLKYDAAIRDIPNSKTRVAFFTDPFGTYVEITENLAPAK